DLVHAGREGLFDDDLEARLLLAVTVDERLQRQPALVRHGGGDYGVSDLHAGGKLTSLTPKGNERSYFFAEAEIGTGTNCFTRFPVFASNKRTCPSKPPVAICAPSGLNAIAWIDPWWPERVICLAPVLAS